MEQEIWRDIEGFEGLYQVSSWGRVKSLERYIEGRWGAQYHKGRILSACRDTSGHLMVHLTKNKIGRHVLVHRLVAQAFIPNPENLPCINHKDEDPTNNHISNLEWCTVKYNVNYGTCIQRRIETYKRLHRKAKPIYQLSLDGSEILNVYYSLTEAEAGVNGDFRNISACALGKKTTAYGYKWIYAKDLLKPFRQENKEEKTSQ